VRLVGHFFQDLSEAALAPGENAVDAAFQAALEVSRLRSSPAATAIRDADVSTFRFSLPKMKEQEIRLAVAHELEENTGVSPSEMNYDYAVVGEDPTRSETVEVKAWFAKREAVAEKVSPIVRAGLSCRAVETELMAIVEMLDFNGYIQPEQVQVVIDLGESHVELGLVSDGELKVTRHVQVGMGLVTRVLQETLGLSLADAEKRRSEYSFSSEAAEGSDPSSRAAAVIDDAITGIFREIKEAVDFFRECPESYGRIDRILLTGGGSQIRDIDKVHELFFKAPTTVANPFKNIDIFSGPDPVDAEEIARLAPYMSVAVGLALASVDKEAA
jgi:type IV pilus assembly protein PilM